LSLFKNSWLKAGIYSFSQNASTILFGFGSFYILVREISKSDFGVWALFLAVTTIFESVRIGLIKFGFIRYYTSEGKTEHSKILTASTILNVFVTVLGLIIIFILSREIAGLWDTPQLVQMLYLYGITAILLIPFHQLEYLLHANFHFKGIFVSHLIRGSLFFVFVLGSFLGLYKLDLYTLVIVRAVAVAIAVIFSFLYSRQFISGNLLFDFNRTIWEWITKLFNYGKYVTATSISGILYGAIDQFMLGSILNTASVAIYNTSYRISNLVNTPTLTIAALVFPYTSKISKDSDRSSIKRIYEKAVGFNLAIIIPPIIVVLLVPETLIYLIAGEQYIDAVPLLQIIILYRLFVPFSRLFGTVLDSTGQPHINFYFTFSGLSLNVVLNYFLILQYGTLGAAFGTMISSILTFIFMQVTLFRKYNITILGALSHLLSFYVLSWQLIIKRLKNLSRL
jgi:lipopolysaccharide exporter